MSHLRGRIQRLLLLKKAQKTTDSNTDKKKTRVAAQTIKSRHVPNNQTRRYSNSIHKKYILDFYPEYISSCCCFVCFFPCAFPFVHTMLAQAAFDAEQMSPFFHSWLSTAHIPEQNMNVERHLSLSSNKLFTSSEMTYLKERFGFLEILCRTTFFYTYQEHDAAKFQTCVDLFSSFSKTHALLLVLFTRHAQKGRFYFSSCNSTWLEYILEHKLDCLFSLASPFFEHVVDFARLFTCLFTLPLEFSTSSLALIHQANAWYVCIRFKRLLWFFICFFFFRQVDD